ncbi:MAG: sulfite exporter TauE/SafE family protein [Janthinobacterium lividum]
MTILILLLAGVWAGTQNALAGGGSFVTFAVLLLTGVDARAANITSTIALFPGQVATGWAVRHNTAGAGPLPFRALMAISLAGGAIGAVLLLATPADFFARLVPWLVLFATAVFAWGSFRRRPAPTAPPRRALGPWPAAAAQSAISIYGGYFGGGIGFLMLAALAVAGQTMRQAGATKNVLAGAMNASAMLIFVFSPEVRWIPVAALAAGSIAGGQLGAWLLLRANERLLRAGVVLIGIALTVGLFVQAP